MIEIDPYSYAPSTQTCTGPRCALYGGYPVYLAKGEHYLLLISKGNQPHNTGISYYLYRFLGIL
jgi:hypothetical protein